MAEPNFVERVKEILVDTGAPPESLTIEITESVIMRNTERSLTTLHALKSLGVRLAIDDFGTGYSSLSYLQKFPVDVLKIDRAFVEGVQHGASDTALARTIVALGQTLGLQTVAEGVELESQRKVLHSMGCMLGQGYLFSHPREVEELTSWLDLDHVRRFSPIAAMLAVAETSA
jgi:EAL domain-containing protein (putative c-di-GMP-specific phosphodiesterase class I)